MIVPASNAVPQSMNPQRVEHPVLAADGSTLSGIVQKGRSK
jgi:hypothetical protein